MRPKAASPATLAVSLGSHAPPSTGKVAGSSVPDLAHATPPQLLLPPTWPYQDVAKRRSRSRQGQSSSASASPATLAEFTLSDGGPQT
jgi:hypothetical protein